MQFDEMTSTEKTVFILYLFLSILAMTAALVTMVYLFFYFFVGGGGGGIEYYLYNHSSIMTYSVRIKDIQ